NQSMGLTRIPTTAVLSLVFFQYCYSMKPPEPGAEDGCEPKEQMGNIHHQQGCQQQEEKRVELLNK
ncbi:MAG: hypothetical protein ACK56F_24715, partial [bacterium]